mgnify:CR=1 FL=1
MSRQYNLNFNKEDIFNTKSDMNEIKIGIRQDVVW